MIIFFVFIGIVCQKPFVSGPCYANHKKWHFNQATSQCELFTYGGCSGNGNNFDTKKDCERKCKPTTPTAAPAVTTELKKEKIVAPIRSSTLKEYKKPRPFSWPSVKARAPVLCECKLYLYWKFSIS